MTLSLTSSHLSALKSVYKLQITQGTSLVSLQDDIIEELIDLQLIKRSTSPSKFLLTTTGRSQLKVVLTGGVYDLLHSGHIQTLKAASELGNFLVVVVATPSVVNRTKKREPINSIDDRIAVLNAIRYVDIAISGNPQDRLITVKKVLPDIIALGSNQKHNEQSLLQLLKSELAVPPEIVRIPINHKGMSTSKLISRILENKPSH